MDVLEGAPLFYPESVGGVRQHGNTLPKGVLFRIFVDYVRSTNSSRRSRGRVLSRSNSSFYRVSCASVNLLQSVCHMPLVDGGSDVRRYHRSFFFVPAACILGSTEFDSPLSGYSSG